MDTINTVNASLNALRLRSGKTFWDLAEQAACVLWNDLAVRGGEVCMDAHRYTALTRRLHEVLSRRIGVCEPCTDPTLWDKCARTGGGAPMEAQMPPICARHTERLTQECGDELAGLFKEFEQAAREFTHHDMDARIQKAMKETLKPFLIKNLATRYCEDCGRAFRKAHS